MAILTTTIGAYPKPDYAPVPNWFDLGETRREAPTEVYDRLVDPDQGDFVALLDRATEEVVREQDALGLDIPTDGEARREHYVYYHCRHLVGFDFDELTRRVMRHGSWAARVPTVTGPITASEPFLPRDWRVAQAVTEKPVKITVPGPLTIVDSTADSFYRDEKELAFALADAINVEVLRLASAGCRWIQVDEPVFARAPDRALAFGIEALARCFEGLETDVQKVVHICCGYPAALDQEDYPKADRQSYFALADALEAAPVDAISIEDAHRKNDLSLLERFGSTKVILGLVDISKTRVEGVEEISDRISDALNHIDSQRLIAAPDCGLTMLPRALAKRKLTNLVAAASIA